MAPQDQVLVAILREKRDLEIAREQHWYRIPVESVEKLLKKRWAPKWIAFYQPKVFGDEAYAIHYYARIRRITKAYRWELFPDEIENKKTQKQYYKLELSPLKKLPKPIPSFRRRRISFIFTTLIKLKNAVEINDLSDESPLEDELWGEFKKLAIPAERQEQIKVKEKNYFLDFAIYCAKGNLNIETDGDTWHTNKEQVTQDNQRNNDLHTLGWHTLRFNTHQVREEMANYCLPTIVEAINRLGGIGQKGQLILNLPKSNYENYQQLNLFE